MALDNCWVYTKNFYLRFVYNFKIQCVWVGGRLSRKIMPLRGPILQSETFQIFSQTEIPRQGLCGNIARLVYHEPIKRHLPLFYGIYPPTCISKYAVKIACNLSYYILKKVWKIPLFLNLVCICVRPRSQTLPVLEGLTCLYVK